MGKRKTKENKEVSCLLSIRLRFCNGKKVRLLYRLLSFMRSLGGNLSPRLNSSLHNRKNDACLGLIYVKFYFVSSRDDACRTHSSEVLFKQPVQFCWAGVASIHCSTLSTDDSFVFGSDSSTFSRASHSDKAACLLLLYVIFMDLTSRPSRGLESVQSGDIRGMGGGHLCCFSMMSSTRLQPTVTGAVCSSVRLRSITLKSESTRAAFQSWQMLQLHTVCVWLQEEMLQWCGGRERKRRVNFTLEFVERTIHYTVIMWVVLNLRKHSATLKC